jgi:hypothetical protein
MVSLFTSLDSPQSSLKIIWCLLRKLSNHQLHALNSVFPSSSATFIVYSCTTGPDTWWFFALTLTISLTSSFAVFLNFLLIFH